MHPLIPLAHGALGPYDELLPLLVLVIFLVMVAVAWFTGRKSTPPAPPANPTNPAPSPAESKTADHHRLD